MEDPRFTFLNPFDYEKLIKSESEVFKKRGVEEYQVNEIKLRLFSAPSLGFFIAVGAVCFLLDAWWWKALGMALIQIAICLFCYRRGCLNGYVWGHQVGFESGIDKALNVDDALRKKLHEELIEIKVGMGRSGY